MKKALLFISLALVTSFSMAQTDLFFSEYCEGSGNNKGVEIYNPTDAAIDLSDYWVVRYSNGNSTFAEGGVTQLEGVLEPYETHVLVNGQTTSTPTSPACSPEMQALADQLDHDYPAPTYMNGNDAIALIKTQNGETPNGTNGIPVDLIGQIGLGSAISAETGWSYVQDSTLSYTNSNGDPIEGKVINYIVQKYATNGSDFGPFWMSWTSGHSLIRKPEIVEGVKTNPDPFVVTMEWDTLPAQIDSTGYYSYENIWDNLGTHACVADPNYSSVGAIESNSQLKIFPNPVVDEHLTLNSNLLFKTVRLYDLLGKLIYTRNLDNPVLEAEIYLDNKLQGLYLVEVIFDNESTTTHKILVK